MRPRPCEGLRRRTEPFPGSAFPPPERSPGFVPLGCSCSGPALGNSWGAESLNESGPHLTQQSSPSLGWCRSSLGEGMNLFLFPSITVFLLFLLIQVPICLRLQPQFLQMLPQPCCGPAAGSCCPDCLHPNPQDHTNLELQRGLATWQGLPCCSQHLLELAGCWGGFIPSLHLPGPGFGQNDQYMIWSCRWMYPGTPALDSAGTAPPGLSLGLLGAQRFGSCLCLSPASCFRHSGSGQCQLTRLLLGWLVSLGQGSAAAQYWHLCVNSICSCGKFWELSEATGAALASLWPDWCWEHHHASVLY